MRRRIEPPALERAEDSVEELIGLAPSLELVGRLIACRERERTKALDAVERVQREAMAALEAKRAELKLGRRGRPLPVEVSRPINDRAKAEIERHQTEGATVRSHLELKLIECGTALKPRPGELAFEFCSSCVADYSTQTQPAHYACARVKLNLEAPRRLGLKTDVRGRGFDGPEAHREFIGVVMVRSRLDGELLRWMPGLETVEWVRMCWALGANPRVFNPYLPHGFEAAHGLDYFGGRAR